MHCPQIRINRDSQPPSRAIMGRGSKATPEPKTWGMKAFFFTVVTARRHGLMLNLILLTTEFGMNWVFTVRSSSVFHSF